MQLGIANQLLQYFKIEIIPSDLAPKAGIVGLEEVASA